MIRHQMGVRVEAQPILELDDEYWSEIIGELEPEVSQAKRAATQDAITFPLPLRAQYKEQTYQARLLNRQGEIEYEGNVYSTPTTAAKLITVDWKAVNGWDFWRYRNPETGKWERIGRLKAN